MRCSVHQPAAAGWRVVLLWAQQTEGVWAAGRRQTVGVWAVEEKRDSWTFCNKFEQNNKKRLWERQRGRETWFLFSQTDLNSSICKFKCNNVDWMGRKHCHNCPDISEFHTHTISSPSWDTLSPNMGVVEVGQKKICWFLPLWEWMENSAHAALTSHLAAKLQKRPHSKSEVSLTLFEVWGP